MDSRVKCKPNGKMGYKTRDIVPRPRIRSGQCGKNH